MSGPQFELPVSVSEEKIDKEKVVKVGRLCYICEERYPVLFEGIMKEFKANIMDPLLSHSQSSYSAVVTSFRRLTEIFIVKRITAKLGLIPRPDNFKSRLNELENTMFDPIVPYADEIRNRGNAGVHGVDSTTEDFFDKLDPVSIACLNYRNYDERAVAASGKDVPRDGVFEPYFVSK